MDTFSDEMIAVVCRLSTGTVTLIITKNYFCLKYTNLPCVNCYAAEKEVNLENIYSLLLSSEKYLLFLWYRGVICQKYWI